MAADTRKYTLWFLLLLGLLLFLNGIWAISIDAYKVFGFTNFNQRNFEPNTRFLKIEHLKLNKFDGFIIGSSRANFYPVEVAQRLTGYKFYNLNADSETTYGAYIKIHWLLKNNKPKMIVWALDFDRFYLDPNQTNLPLLSIEHPDVSRQNKLLFFWKYFWPHPKHYLIALYGNLIKHKTWYKFQVDTGEYKLPLFDRWMKKDINSYIKKRFPNAWNRSSPKPNQKQIEYFEKVIQLFKREKIDFKILINPIHHLRFKSFDTKVYQDWLAAITSIAGSVWDFSGLNSVTTNNSLYYENSHFTAKVGKLALDYVFNESQFRGHIPNDFGRRLTPDN